MSAAEPRAPSMAPAWAPWLGLLLVAAPLLAVLHFAVPASVDVPYIDDYDALLGFLKMHDQTPSTGARLRLLVEHHNEHLMVLPRLAALATRSLTGHIDFGTLNLLGGVHLLLLVVALFLAFRRGESVADRLLPFAPAVLLLIHLQYWMVYLSATTALSSVAVVSYAALAFVALARGGAAGILTALLLGFASTVTLANGFLVFPIGLVVPLLERRWAQAALWALAAAALLAFHFAVIGPPVPATDPLTALEQPLRLLRYALNLVGCAAGFSQPGVSLAMGAVLVVALAAATLRGLPRRSPALFALLLFLAASVAANALARAASGPGLPLLQPRYRFYGALLLALTYLSWAELLRDGRRALAAALVASTAFSVASFHSYREQIGNLSRRLAEGYERWWVTGDGGLQYPDFPTANGVLLHGLDAGWLRPPPEWLERHAAWPIPRDPPPADGAVEFRLHVVSEDANALYVSGWARAGSSIGQEVELVLRSARRTLVFPATSIPRVDTPVDRPEAARQRIRSGFRALLPKQALPPGRYRLGILVRRGSREHLSYLRTSIDVTGRDG